MKQGLPIITTASLKELSAGRPVDPRVTGLAMLISNRQRFFHWPIEFPEVFAQGGFDVLLSNPPWEHVELKEQEFFATRDARIALARTKNERSKLIRALSERNPALFIKYSESLREIDGNRQFLAGSGRFVLTGKGRINTYSVFAELATHAVKSSGRAGVILPKGIATDDTTKDFFGSIVSEGRLIDLIGFENEEFIFPAIDHRVTFCKITIAGQGAQEHKSRIGFYIRRFSQLAEQERFFTLEKDDFWLLNPNTGNCPIFRSQADAELTKAIYRRVPILWREAKGNQPEVNPWRIKFLQGLFNMSSDSEYFWTAEELRADGCRLEGNVFVSPYAKYLPLYEAKMLHQFDHRFSTYEGATEKQLNVGILPQPTAEQKRDPNFVVQPRYWVQEEIVESAIPYYPEPLAMALRLEHRPSIQRVLTWWLAGFHLAKGDSESAATLLYSARRYDLEKTVARFFKFEDPEKSSCEFQEIFPLTEIDAKAIVENLEAPENLARELVHRFSPKWYMGWRDITNAGNERTLLVSCVPRSAVGHKFQLIFSALPVRTRLCLQAILNSWIVDYCARQKLGGTSLSYFILKQMPVVSPDILESFHIASGTVPLVHLIASRTLELCYSANDLAGLAADSGLNQRPFLWDENRRFQVRCELDAAIFHLYLPSTVTGEWLPTKNESPSELCRLQRHLPTPRDAVGFILDQFHQTKQDESPDTTLHPKERVLEIYDAILSAQKAGRPYVSMQAQLPGQPS